LNTSSEKARGKGKKQLQSSDLKTQHVKVDEDDEEEEGSMVLDLGHRFRRVQAYSPLLSQKPQPLFSPWSLHPPHQHPPSYVFLLLLPELPLIPISMLSYQLQLLFSQWLRVTGWSSRQFHPMLVFPFPDSFIGSIYIIV